VPRHHRSVLILAMLLAACTQTPGTRPATSSSTTTSSTSSTTTTSLPPTTTTVPMPPTTVPRPVPVTTPPVPRATACPPEIVTLVHKHFDRFGIDVADWFVGIVWRESNCRQDVTSPTGCRGLAQLALPLHADLFTALGFDWRTSWMDPDANLAAAALLYASSGASPWRL
jgi:hypothetical protein